MIHFHLSLPLSAFQPCLGHPVTCHLNDLFWNPLYLSFTLKEFRGLIYLKDLLTIKRPPPVFVFCFVTFFLYNKQIQIWSNIKDTISSMLNYLKKLIYLFLLTNLYSHPPKARCNIINLEAIFFPVEQILLNFCSVVLNNLLNAMLSMVKQHDKD